MLALPRHRRLPHIGITILMLLSLVSFEPGTVTAAGTTELISITPGGSAGNSSSGAPSVSADGSVVAFVSLASDLVAGDTNGEWDAFVLDRNSGATERVSVSSGGAQGNGITGLVAISADGRYVAFDSEASNLVAGDSNNVSDIFVHDRETNITTLVSKSSSGVQADGASMHTSISADGRYIAFMSEATNLVASDTNGVADIFVHDRVTGVTERVSVADGTGAQGNFISLETSISADGRYVAFKSAATNLVPSLSTTELQVYVRDRQTGSTVLVSRHSNGTPGNDTSELPVISGNGRYVAFESEATNLADDVTASFPNLVYVHDLVTGTTEVVCRQMDGTPTTSACLGPVISFDGRYVAFTSLSSQLVPDDTNSTFDVFVRDRIAGINERVSVSSAGVEGNGQSNTPGISADGLYVAFQSIATNLTPAADTNSMLDVFIHDRMPAGPEPVVSAGDDAQVYVGEQFTQSGSFDDPDSDTWDATVDYGDGAGPQALALNPDKSFTLSHIYQDIGFHTVTVEVCDAEENCGSDTVQVLVIQSPLIVSAGFTQTVTVGDTVSLDPATFTDPDNLDSHTATIDWGDGSSLDAGVVDQALNEVQGSHVYSATGTYNVIVCVQDNVSLEDCDSFLVNVNPAAATAPSVDAGPDAVIDEGGTFDRNGAFTDPDSSSWSATADYGDGSGEANLPLTGMTFALSHAYADNGAYTVEVCVTDDGNEEGCDSLLVTVNNVAPTVNAGSDQTAQASDTVNLAPATFSDPGTEDTHTASIDWGDGSPVASGTVDQALGTVTGSHSYTTDGLFTVEVCVTDDDSGEGCDSFTVTVGSAPVNQPPVVDLGDSLALGDEGTLFTRPGGFGDADSSAWTATVDYGDGGGIQNLPLSGMSFALSHTYAENGVYTLEVCVTDDSNAEGCDSISVTISNVAPNVEAGPNQVAGPGALVTLPPAIFNDPGPGDTHTATVDWGDGSPVADGTVDQSAHTVSASHSYAVAGVYTVLVCVTDDDAGQGCDTFTVTVRAAPQPPVLLCANRYTGAVRLPAGECATGETALELPDDLPLTLCANRYTGQLRYATRGCSTAELRLDLPASGPLDVCVSHFTSAVRYAPSPSRCTQYERHVVLGWDI